MCCEENCKAFAAASAGEASGAELSIAQTRVRYGYRIIRALLNREGWKVGKDLVYRLYKEEGLGLRKRRAGRGGAVVHRQERFKPTGPKQVWAMDFVSDQLCDGDDFVH